MNPADKVEHWPIDKLVPYARNSRTHSDQQVAQIAASIKEWGFTTAVLVDESGSIIAGHGRILAARKLGMKDIPVMVAEGWTDAQKRAYVIADNKLALNAGWDDDMLRLELGELHELDYNMDLLGFDGDELGKLMYQDFPETLAAQPNQNVDAVFEIAVTCKNEQQQEEIYKMLTDQGYICRVLTI